MALNKDQIYLLKLFLISVFGIVGIFGTLIVTFYFVTGRTSDLSESGRFNITAAAGDDDSVSLNLN